MVYHRQCTINLCNIGERNLEWAWIPEEPDEEIGAQLILPVKQVVSLAGTNTVFQYAHTMPDDGVFTAGSISFFIQLADEPTLPVPIALSILRFVTIAPSNAGATLFGGTPTTSEGVTFFGTEQIDAAQGEINSENSEVIVDAMGSYYISGCVPFDLSGTIYIACDHIGAAVLAFNQLGQVQGADAQIQVNLASGSRP